MYLKITASGYFKVSHINICEQTSDCYNFFFFFPYQEIGKNQEIICALNLAGELGLQPMGAARGSIQTTFSEMTYFFKALVGTDSKQYSKRFSGTSISSVILPGSFP